MSQLKSKMFIWKLTICRFRKWYGSFSYSKSKLSYAQLKKKNSQCEKFHFWPNTNFPHFPPFSFLNSGHFFWSNEKNSNGHDMTMPLWGHRIFFFWKIVQKLLFGGQFRFGPQNLHFFRFSFWKLQFFILNFFFNRIFLSLYLE